jgi:hypothetical protein
MKSSEVSEKPAVWRQVVSVFFLPAIGLCWLGYRLQGVRCTYQVGNFDVTPLERVTERQYVLMRAFPLIVGIFFMGLVLGLAYLLNIPIN